MNQDGVGYPGWAGDRTEAVNRPLRRALLAADHVLYQSEFSKRSADLFLGEPRGIMGGASERRRRRTTSRRPSSATLRRPGAPPGGRPDPGLSPRAGTADARRAPAAPPRRPPARDRASRLAGRAARRASWGCATESSSSATTRNAMHRPSSAERTCSCIPRCWTRARRSCSRRWRPGFRSSIRRAAGRSSSSATRAESAFRTPSRGSATSHPRPKRSRTRSTCVLADLAGYSARARARAVERFSLEPWLDRHSALFSGLVSR